MDKKEREGNILRATFVTSIIILVVVVATFIMLASGNVASFGPFISKELADGSNPQSPMPSAIVNIAFEDEINGVDLTEDGDCIEQCYSVETSCRSQNVDQMFNEYGSYTCYEMDRTTGQPIGRVPCNSCSSLTNHCLGVCTSKGRDVPWYRIAFYEPLYGGE